MRLRGSLGLPPASGALLFRPLWRETRGGKKGEKNHRPKREQRKAAVTWVTREAG